MNALRTSFILLLAASSAPALALASVSESVAIPTVQSEVATLIWFDKFDPSLGELQSVNVSFTASASAMLILTNDHAYDVNVTMDPFGTASLYGVGYEIHAFYAPPVYPLQVLAGSTVFHPVSFQFAESGAVGSSLGSYVGGGQIGFIFEPFLRVFWTGPSVSDHSLFIGPASGRATITYNYEPTVVTPGVPEPESWAMLIAGFGLVGMAGRRRHQMKSSAA